jgi:hypothetical protein
MITKTKSDKKSLIIACIALAAVIIITIVTLLILPNKNIDDSFFVSDGSKYVLTIDSEDVLSLDFKEYTPEKTHLVYFYSGDNITDLKVYCDFKTEENAKKAAEIMKTETDESIKDVSINGKYVVITMDKSQYEDMSADDAKQQIELMEMLQNLDSEESEIIEIEE